MFLADIEALTEWSDIYVIVGAAAGVLVGLMFVVIASGGTTVRSLAAAEAYATPTVVHGQRTLRGRNSGGPNPTKY